MSKAKSFDISKRKVWEAYERVKARKGAAGVDSMSLEEFERKLKNNLYKIWNRMSSGTYFPPPVRTVEIPKKAGGKRALGIPTVGDRVAQMVVKLYLEPEVEPHFHPDSYGYRPGKSAHDALAVARQRCWRYDWVIDMDIRGFFDNLNHKLVMRAVKRFTDCQWILLYVERWLKAPALHADGTLVERDRGTPQGGVISPLLANIFLHLAFDEWMRKKHPRVPFERYADDVIVHCRTEVKARLMKESIEERLAKCKLELHPGKSQIVYCKDENRRGNHPNTKFDFLGYTFRPRQAKGRRGYFISFSPAVSREACKSMRRQMRRWALHRHSNKSLESLAANANPVLRGWIQYYGRFNKSALNPVFSHFNRTLTRWASWKYKKLSSKWRAVRWLGRRASRQPTLFAHWQLLGIKPAVG